MTALMSLRSRLALAKVAVHLADIQAAAAGVAPLIGAGVDLLVLGSSGSDERDVEKLTAFREAQVGGRLLLAVDNAGIAARVSADVVHVERPGWRMWGDYPRGHQWTLLGRGAMDARTVRRPGEEWDYMFVGPLADADPASRALVAALESQRPFEAGALPWFALGDWDAGQVEELAAHGVRRVALSIAHVDADAVSLVAEAANLMRAAWDGDEAAQSYRLASLAL